MTLKPAPSRRRDCLLHARQEVKILQPRRRYGTAVTLHIGVDDAVAVEKDGAHHHLVAFFCSFGCETRQCQTTAWKASAMRRDRGIPTVGMTTTTSPAFLV